MIVVDDLIGMWWDCGENWDEMSEDWRVCLVCYSVDVVLVEWFRGCELCLEGLKNWYLLLFFGCR